MSEKEKWLTTMKVYDEYERRFAKARTEKVLRFPTDQETRQSILEETKKVLGYREELIPQIHSVEEISYQDFDGYRVTQLRYMTWEGFYACASLYMPKTEKKVPLVFELCGHGKYGRLTPCYTDMAHSLVRLGMAVIVPDNIGQGDREWQGHWNCVAPFYCGLTLQGMIVMETIALIRYMAKDPRIDAEHMASCGNSGGGTLNLFLAALAPELCALSSSGYPSEFAYILSKEREHCACNLLPGIAHGPEMWEILSLFAPKPMLLEQGVYDSLIPCDYAQRNARKLKNIYMQMGKPDNFEFVATPTMHSWSSEDIYVISNFLAGVLGVSGPSPENNEIQELPQDMDSWHVFLPEDSKNTDCMAECLTGKKMPAGTVLSDVYPPVYEGRKLEQKDIMPDLGRGNVMRVLAQMECTLWKE